MLWYADSTCLAVSPISLSLSYPFPFFWCYSIRNLPKMNQVNRFKGAVGNALKMKDTDGNLVNKSSGRIWSNQDMDPVAPERRNWTAWTFASYWIAESWGPTAWSVGSSMVAGGLLWWHALLACIVGHFIAALLTVWNGRGGAVYHIGVCWNHDFRLDTLLAC